ncbi:glucosamine-6-phosphate deaminase [Halobacillus sp. K22]|uniref:glucosamine-6-phosphate deaminase n=1 Tax=Halobacillus sp. K22 TaxID=3457431 RepID=UPI003FCE632A
MKILVSQDYQSLSQKACGFIEEEVNRNPASVLGLATGSTPLQTYHEMAEGHKTRAVDYHNISTINLDEYVGLGESDPQSYHFFMKEHLFDKVNINQARTYIPNGLADDLEEECSRYEQLIDQIGPPDLQILGIGQNGHIGFNEPRTSFKSETHIIKLAESTRKANARFFKSLEDVPKSAITMGIQSILKSKKILLLASGENKAEAIRSLLEDPPSDDVPASALCFHKNVTLLVDKEAYKKVEYLRGDELNHD